MTVRMPQDTVDSEVYVKTPRGHSAGNLVQCIPQLLYLMDFMNYCIYSFHLKLIFIVIFSLICLWQISFVEACCI